MNTSLTFVATGNHTYILNGVELSKADLGLLLEMEGLDVIYDLPDRLFYAECFKSIARLDPEEFFTILDDFTKLSEEDKIWWRNFIQFAFAATVYSSPN